MTVNISSVNVVGVDRLGGMSTSEQHAVFTSTKPKAIRLGTIYREKLLAKISLNVRPASATAK